MITKMKKLTFLVYYWRPTLVADLEQVTGGG